MGTITKVANIVWVNYGSGMAQRLGTDVEIIAYNGGITNTDDIPYDIIKKAIKNYPKGIAFKGILNDDGGISNGILDLVDSGKNIICGCINDGYRYVYHDGDWAEIITQPKFKIGDKVKVIEPGSGCGIDELNKVVTITDIGIYCSQMGYKVLPAIGNSETGYCNGFIGESSFELVIDKTLTLADVLQVGKYYLVKDVENNDIILLVERIKGIAIIAKDNLAVYGHDIYLNAGRYYDNISWSEVKEVVREATPEEIEWLDACIKAEKFVPQSELKKSNVDKCNLIQGEYYHIIDDVDSHWIIKFDKVINGIISNYKSIVIPENSYYKGGFSYYKGGLWGGFDVIKSIYNATPEEIDLLNKFEDNSFDNLTSGEFYYIETNDNKYIGRYLSNNNDCIYLTGSIISICTNTYNWDIYFPITKKSIKSYRLATNDEISFLRFCEKANTFLKQNEYYKVICNSDDQYIIQFDKIENDIIYTINDIYTLKDKEYSRFRAVANFAGILKIETASPTEIKLLTDKRFDSTTETLYMEPLRVTMPKKSCIDNMKEAVEEWFLKKKTSTEHLEIKQNNLFNVPKI